MYSTSPHGDGLMETVTVIPQSSLDSDGNPVSGGEPLVLNVFAVEPGNTAQQFGDTGDVDSVDFSVYFLDRLAPVHDDDAIVVRGRTCRARVKEWRDPWPGDVPLEGLVVLCHSTTGAS